MPTPGPLRIPVAAAVAAAGLLVVAGCSSRSSRSASSSAAAGVRTVDISMVDNAYQPASPISATKGETVKFVFHNNGKLPHEATLGDMAAQDAHENEMAKPGGVGGMGGMGHGAGATSSVDVPAGKSASFTKTFDTTGELVIGCHYPGHYASMHLPVTVS